MIKSLYPVFQKWSEKGSVYIISDSHFDDKDMERICKEGHYNWMSAEDYLTKIKKRVFRNDTLIHLGDVGNPKWLKELKCHKVLITGNHDTAKQEAYFDEVYRGPLFIGEKILLSHEPVFVENAGWVNIHGHVHDGKFNTLNHINLCANIYNWEIFNLGEEIKKGLFSNIKTFHRNAIDKAVNRVKSKKGAKK